MAVQSLLGAVSIIFLGVVLWKLYPIVASPLRSVPGPFLARLSRLWLLLSTLRQHHEQDTYTLHKQHGKVVRLAPHEYSIDDPEAVKVIYSGAGRAWRKSDWYMAFETPHEPNLFSKRDIPEHAKQRRKYANAYSMSSMSSYEGYVTDTIQILFGQLRRMSSEGKPVDISHWLQCFAFDVIGEISFSKRIGFLDAGADIDNLMSTIHSQQMASVILAIIPEWISTFISTTPLLDFLGLVDQKGRRRLENYFRAALSERTGPDAKTVDSPDAGTERNGPEDFLNKFYSAHQKDPEYFTMLDLKQGIANNVIAGSDTTGIALTALTYYLYRDPRVLEILRREVDTTSDPITFAESQNLEYFQAVIKEALRLWPSTGTPFFRVVPDGGAVVSGTFFPAGEILSINPWVAHRNTDIFGSDALDFRPERWLKSVTPSEKLSQMNAYWMPFGLGSRACIGKHISLLEIGKLIPQLVRHFDIKLNDDVLQNGPRSKNIQFMLFQNMQVEIRVRQGSISMA